MCIAPLYKYYLFNIISYVFILVGFIFIFNGFEEIGIVFLILFYLVGLIGSKFCRCPKCNHLVGANKDEIVEISFKYNCLKCGLDLRKCKKVKKKK